MSLQRCPSTGRPCSTCFNSRLKDSTNALCKSETGGAWLELDPLCKMGYRIQTGAHVFWLAGNPAKNGFLRLLWGAIRGTFNYRNALYDIETQTGDVKNRSSQCNIDWNAMWNFWWWNDWENTTKITACWPSFQICQSWLSIQRTCWNKLDQRLHSENHCTEMVCCQ